MNRNRLLAAASCIAALALCLAGCARDTGDGGGGGNKILAKGGTGGIVNGSGGEGGYFDLYKEGGSGRIALLKSGSADASFTPRTFTPIYGDKKLTIATSTTLTILNTNSIANEDFPAAGVAYVVLSPAYIDNSYMGEYFNIFISNGTIANVNQLLTQNHVTGIEVKAGATLTLPLNYVGEGTYTRIDLAHDLANYGTIKSSKIDNSTMSSMEFNMDSYLGSGSLDTKGTLPGQSGGDIDFDCDGSFANSGPITTQGADMEDGNAGSGGDFYVWSDYFTENTAAINTSGGMAVGNSGTGGNAGSLELESDYAQTNNSGTLTAKGGDGVDGGGSGGYTELYACCVGGLHNTGNIITSGGGATKGNGGSAGDIYIQTYGGDLKSSGTLTATGGSTTGNSFNGGAGGDIDIELAYYDDYVYGDYRNPGSMIISGAIDSSGGSASSEATATGTGGDAGDIEIDQYNDTERGDWGVCELRGYSEVNTSGGDANYPGDGEYIYVYSDYNNEMFPPGAIYNELDLDSRGGSVLTDAVSNAMGGYGGYVNLETNYTNWFAPYPAGFAVTITNKGGINTSSGTAFNSTSANYAGYVFIYAWDDVTNTGDIAARGGDDLGTAGYGGDGNYVEIYSDKHLENSGDIDVSGGAGHFGGDADYIDMGGLTFNNTGNMLSEGGDADAAVTGSVGGDGSWVELWYNGTSSGTFSCAGGTGKTKGSDGYAEVMGHQVYGTNN